MKNFILIILLLIFINVYILNFSKLFNDYTYDPNNNEMTYFKFGKDKVKKNSIETLPHGFKLLFSNYNINSAKTVENSSIVFFSLLVDYIELYPIFQKIKKPLRINSLLCIDTFASKAKLYQLLNENKALCKKFLPITYIINDDLSFEHLMISYDKNKLYILKKNIQRQKGCTITNNKTYIHEARKNNYVVCQELLTNPFTVDGHKINLRQYLFVTIIRKKISFKLFNDGFIYYTPKKYNENSIDKDRHITTGYIDRKIYDKNPMTVKELKHKIGNNSTIILENNLKGLFRYVASIYSKILLEYDSNQHLNFVIFGCDIAIGSNLDCKLMEINKGPDLSFKDERDGNVKKTLISNVLHEINVINEPHENFINIY